jgi:PAS domain S-box-containing protein
MAAYEDLTKEQLINDLIRLRQRIHELEKIKDQHERTHEELVRTRSMYRGLFEFAPDAIVVVNRDGHIVQINAQAERLFGYGRDEMLDKPVENLMPESFRQRHLEQRQGYFYKPRVRPMGTELDLYGKRKDGSEFPVDISLGPLEIEKDLFVVSVIRDITLRKQMEEELRRSRDELETRVHERTRELEIMNEALKTENKERQRIEIELRNSENRLRRLPAELLAAQEKERKRIAQEIHDGVGSSLAALSYKVEDALKQIGDDHPRTRAALESVISVTQGTIEEARRIQMALRPSILDDLGILATLKWFCRQFESTYSSIRIKQEIDIQEHEVPDPLKTVIFRVMQEALNNIAKHSKANLVNIRLRNAGRIELLIQDNGQGFDPAEKLARESTKRGLGLSSMRERAELSGGSFEIESELGKGTLLRVAWPFNPAAA